MNLQQQNKMQKEIDNLTQLFKALCDDVDMIRETMAKKLLDVPDKKKEEKDIKLREVKELEQLFVNVPKIKKMKEGSNL